jgi:hypothetical protein
VVTICTAQWSLYVPHSGHYKYHTVVTIRTAQWSLYVPHSGHYTYRTVVTMYSRVVTIQDVSRLVHITAGGDFLGLCDQKSLYKHVSDFRRLRSYGHFLIPVHGLVWTAHTDLLAGDVLILVAYRLHCKHYYCHLSRPPSYRRSSFRISRLGRYLTLILLTWRIGWAPNNASKWQMGFNLVFKGLRNAGKMGWVGIRLASVCCMTQLLLRVQKPLSLTVPALDIQNSKAIVS